MQLSVNRRLRALASGALLVLFLLSSPSVAQAYIGPGAGFAFLGSTFIFALTFALGIATFMLWPLRWFWRRARGFGIKRDARARRVIVVGLDGLEPKLVEQYMREGNLPNLAKLSENGTYRRLGTTLPALSPVAWSTFQTGVNPGAHNIFDFLTRDKRSCLPELASTETVPGGVRFRLGRLAVAKRNAVVRITRKSRPFWRKLGDVGIFSNIIRVPISYPPEKFYGNILSAMCTPDLRGSQGTFSYFSVGNPASKRSVTGGESATMDLLREGTWGGKLVGPTDPGDSQKLVISFKLTKSTKSSMLLQIANSSVVLELNRFSEWIEVDFVTNSGARISGICRFCLRQIDPSPELYVSPLNLHPERPALPISSPPFFSKWLAKRQGLFGTLGLMEDTWGRNELAIDDQRFLEQTYLTHAERERMFFDAIDRTKEGLCVCVFDASDRIQHMFWRYLDDQHPAPREDPAFAKVIPEMYQRMDELVGRVTQKLASEDILIVLSDHGFTSFRRCLNINTWLMQEGYLVLKEGKETGADYLADVDWGKTRAYALGLAGLYINRQGREAKGVVNDSEFAGLKTEIANKLKELRDPQSDTLAVLNVYDSTKAYKGLYAEEAPDLIVGYNHGFRVSWESVTGAVERDLFSDNLKAWSGDHHVDPEQVPGVLFINRPIVKEHPHISDIAPTILDLFAVKIPSYMEGKVLI